MKENDQTEMRLRERFAGYESEPPERVWEEIRDKLHPEPGRSAFRAWWQDFPGEKPRQFRIIATSLAAVVVIFLTAVWFLFDDHYALRGHAYAGEVRLCRGTATLFRVGDLAPPYDTVEHYNTAPVDENGYFRFTGVDKGKYLIKVSPEINSPHAKSHHSSWFDQKTDQKDASLIVVADGDVSQDVYLVGK
jgi:hypothetical protein